MHSPPDQAPVPAPSLRALIDRIRSEVGTADAELIKQIVADTGSLERQNARNHFEGRIEFARQMHDQRQATQKYLVEYGLQTLKWMFLLNAGALAAVAAFVSGGVGKSGVGAIAAFVPILKAAWMPPQRVRRAARHMWPARLSVHCWEQFAPD
jgi:hypothetical protein